MSETVTIDGDAKGGFIVQVHDGDRCEAYGVMAADEKAARAEGLKRFRPPVPVVAPVVVSRPVTSAVGAAPASATVTSGGTATKA